MKTEPRASADPAADDRYRFLAEISPVQLWTALPDGNLDYVTDQTAERLGLTPARLLADGWQNVVHPDDLPRAIERWTHALRTGETYEVEFRLKLAAGEYAWHLVRAVPSRDDAGAIVRWFGTNTNIEQERAHRTRIQALLGEVEQQAARLREQNHLLELDAEVGAALATSGSLAAALKACAESLVKHLDAAFARVWTIDETGSVLELQASAGMYTHLDGPHGRVPVGRLKIGQIAAERLPHLTNDVIGDPRVGDQAWAIREGMVAFAGYPLVVGQTVVGVVAVFARHPLSGAALSALGSTAYGLAQTIERRRAEERLRVSEAWLATTLSSIGDGVLATDPDGNVTFLNPVAEALTGWSGDEARGKSLGAIFRIVNEETRGAVESPVAKVLREGVVVALANHTLLLRRDGAEIPIDDSAAPIRGRDGDLTGVVLVFRDAGEKRRSDAERTALLEAEQRARKDAEAARAEMRSLFMQAPTPICVFRGPTHVYELVNPAYMELAGAGRSLLGRPIAEARPELAGLGFGELLDRVYATAERFVGQRRMQVDRRGDGLLEDVVIDFVYDPYYGLDGRVAGVLVIAFDVTERVRQQESAQATLEVRERLLAITEDARHKAELASRAKDEFLATASHELRTPLNAILGWARILRGGTVDPSAFLRGLETIERNAKAQVQLIEDILDGSRIITGKLHLEVRPLDLVALVQGALDAVRPAASARSIALNVSLDPEAAHISGDPDRLQQVIWNLVNNAIKFTPKGGKVDVGVVRSGTHIEVSVRDNGQGISSEFLPHVFERFRQADSTTTRRHGGLGLGLALVRHLVEAHGGTVRAESEGEGKGAAFTLTLPVLAVLPASVELARPTPTSGAREALGLEVLRDLRVLVIDDEPDARELVAAVLRARGADVMTAGAVEAALELAAQRSPHVLVSDIGMPVVDGYALLQRIRGLGPKEAQIPAIALTAYAREQDRRRAMEAGFQAYLAKPVDPEALVQLVGEIARAGRDVAS